MSQQTMIFRGLDAQGDWMFGQGASSYATGQQAIALDVQTRLQMFFGDCFVSLLFGIQWLQLLSSKNPAAQNGILLQTRQMILGSVGGYKSFGVLAINSVDVYEDLLTRALKLDYSIATIYTTSYSGSATVPMQPGG